METLELKAWLKRNKNILRSYAPDEIAYLARLNGFSLDIACSGITDLVTHLKRLMTFWESPLNDQWLDLTAYQRRGDLQEERI